MFAWQGTYTTCERDNEASWLPAWQLRGQRFYFDFETEVGEITGATVRFQDVPILHWPGTLSFPLSSKRKSGVLSPTYGLDTTSGVSLTVPYYFDIAPNRDATVTPTYMTKRGVNLVNEFRYLEPGLQRDFARKLHAHRQAAGSRALVIFFSTQRHLADRRFFHRRCRSGPESQQSRRHQLLA
jgi:lipopolysaccharide assembly outer membrane protein LptD (OstA)